MACVCVVCGHKKIPTLILFIVAVLAACVVAWEVDPSNERRKLVLTRIADFNAKLSRSDRESKYLTMSKSPFAFMRGTDHLYWQDLGTSIEVNEFGNKEKTWLNGDAHINNIGAFTNSQGELVFDLNDFDEAVIGDYQLDLWRMAISIQVVMNYELHLDDTKEVIDAFCNAYLEAIKSPSPSAPITINNTANHKNKLLHKFLKKTLKKKSRAIMLEEYTHVDAEKRTFKPHKDLLPVEQHTVYTQVGHALSPYADRLIMTGQFAQEYFAVKDIVRRVNAGIGGLGMPRYYVLIEGPSTSLDDDIILDLKAQSASSAALNETGNHSKRTVLGYTNMALFPDALLGYLQVENGVHYSVRERNPYKRSFKFERMLQSVSDCKYMAEIWAQILATAHVRANPAFTLLGVVNAEDFAAHTHRMVNAWAKQVGIDFQTFRTRALVEEL